VDRYDQSARRLSLTNDQIAANQQQLSVAQYRLAIARRHLSEAVVAMYKTPASGLLDAALTAHSFDQLVGRVRLWNKVYLQGQEAVASIGRIKLDVEKKGRQLAVQRKQAKALLAQVAQQRAEANVAVQQGQQVLSDAQAEVTRLVKVMKAKRAAAAAAARAAAKAAAAAAGNARLAPVSGVAGDYTPIGWARALLGYLGVPQTSSNITAITAWELAEGGHWYNSARFNPLDTTMPAPGATDMNSVGVKAYTSWAQGFSATVATLRNGLYGPILTALQRGNDAMAVAMAVAGSPWGTGAFGV